MTIFLITLVLAWLRWKFGRRLATPRSEIGWFAASGLLYAVALFQFLTLVARHSAAVAS